MSKLRKLKSAVSAIRDMKKAGLRFNTGLQIENKRFEELVEDFKFNCNYSDADARKAAQTVIDEEYLENE